MQVTGNNLILHKSLSIRLCTDGFSFSVYTPQAEDGRFQFFPYVVDPHVSMSANLKQAFSKVEAMQDQYSSVQVIVDGPTSHVPFEHFEEDEVERLFMYDYLHQQGRAVLYNILSHCNMVVLFCLDKSVRQLLAEHFPEAHYYAAETPVLEHLLEKSKSRDTQKMYAVFSSRGFLVSVMNGGKLCFVNHFPGHDNSDYVYFLLQVWKIQGMNQLQDELHLVGNIPERQALLDELRRYIRQVYVINPSAEYNRFEPALHPEVPYDIIALLGSGC